MYSMNELVGNPSFFIYESFLSPYTRAVPSIIHQFVSLFQISRGVNAIKIVVESLDLMEIVVKVLILRIVYSEQKRSRISFYRLPSFFILMEIKSISQDHMIIKVDTVKKEIFKITIGLDLRSQERFFFSQFDQSMTFKPV